VCPHRPVYNTKKKCRQNNWTESVELFSTGLGLFFICSLVSRLYFSFFFSPTFKLITLVAFILTVCYANGALVELVR